MVARYEGYSFQTTGATILIQSIFGFLVGLLAPALSKLTARACLEELKLIHAALAAPICIQPSPRVEATILAAEDHRFYLHRGVDPVAISRAVWMTVVRKRLQGGSTIEQQFVRRVTGDSRVSIKRKAKEWLLAIEVARLSRKKETVARYLQLAYFGPDCIGLFEASARLVGTHPDNLNLRQAAFLAARLKYPEVPAPAARRVRMVACRTNYILLSVIKEFKRSSIQGLTSVLSPEELAELEAGIGEAQRGEMISGEEFFQQLRRHG